MKLAFKVNTVPPNLYYAGQGEVIKQTIIVDIPDDVIPERIRKIASGKLEEREYISEITVLLEAKK